MAKAHIMQHSISDADNHTGGSAAQTGKVNMLGTDDTGALAQVPAEPIGVAADKVSSGEIVRRRANGYITVPDNATGTDAVNWNQVNEMTSGVRVWWGEVKGDYAGHELVSITDLVPGISVIDTLDNMIYTVESGSGTGVEVTWDEGWEPNRDVIVWNERTESQWYYNDGIDEWHDTGGEGTGEHDIIGNKHYAANNRAGVLHTYLTSGPGSAGKPGILQTVDSSTGQPTAAAGSPLLAAGDAAGSITWGALRLYPGAFINLSPGAVPTRQDLSAVGADTISIVKAGTSVFFCFKMNGSNAFAVEATALEAGS